MNENDLRVKRTKHCLEQALLQILKKKPLEQISVTELCKLSGITRKTFYLHYDNIPQFFEKFVVRLLESLEDSMISTKKNRENSNAPFSPQMIDLFKHVYDHKGFYQIIFCSHSNFIYYRLFYSRMKHIVATSMAAIDEFQELSEFEISYQTNAILGVILEWNNQKYRHSAEELNDIFLKTLDHLSPLANLETKHH